MRLSGTTQTGSRIVRLHWNLPSVHIISSQTGDLDWGQWEAPEAAPSPGTAPGRQRAAGASAQSSRWSRDPSRPHSATFWPGAHPPLACALPSGRGPREAGSAGGRCGASRWPPPAARPAPPPRLQLGGTSTGGRSHTQYIIGYYRKHTTPQSGGGDQSPSSSGAWSQHCAPTRTLSVTAASKFCEQ